MNMLQRVGVGYCLLTICGAAMAQQAPTAGIVHAGLPGEDDALIAVLSETLERAGYAVQKLDADALCDVRRLDASTLDLLILPNAAMLPAASVASIRSYLESGGDILALNAPLWRSLLIRPHGQWTTTEEYAIDSLTEPPDHALFTFQPDEIASWRRAFFPEDAKAVYESVVEGPVPGARSLHAVIENLTNWDNFGPAHLDAPFPEGHTLTVFCAKGGPQTRSLAVEWQEKDGSRWIATVPLTSEWRRYVLAPEDFKFWESNPARAAGQLDPKNVERMNIGLAFTHTGQVAGRHEYWVSAFGTAALTPERREALVRPQLPQMDLLAPTYKFFDSRGVARLYARGDQKIVADAAFAVPAVIRSIQPRPGGGGFDKGRAWRYIPLIETASAEGRWRGAPAALMVHGEGLWKGGQWASFGIEDPAWYKTEAALSAIEGIARAMKRGVYLMDAGANFYTYFEDQSLLLGARVANIQQARPIDCVVRIRVTDAGHEVFAKEWPLAVGSGSETRVSEAWKPESWPANGFKVAAQLVVDGTVVDEVSHEAHVWRPKSNPSFITAVNGDFMSDGKRWRAHGVNYMPSSGIGTEDGPYFEQWLGSRAYDPEIVERDLRHCKDMGLNSVSIFIYTQSVAAQNLLDILRRLDALGMKANLSLRHATLGNFNWPGLQSIIQYYRLWQNDTVFAYDIDWEPLWWTHKERVKWDREWEAWLLERYGSIENAEKDWGMPAPRDESGAIMNPPDDQLQKDGGWRVMASAYRRFLDTLLYTSYNDIRSKIRGIDPNHFVSFRMTETADPTMNWGGVLPYDFPYLAAAVDILEPEGYGRIGDWEKIKPGWFQYEYARLWAPDKPLFWAEAGLHAWDMGTMSATPQLLERQGEFYRDFYRMVISSGADGIYWWWYPGGFRVGENSDYGIIECDGTDRDSTRAIRENTQALLDGPDAKAVDHWIEIDRDRYANGIVGVYDNVKDEFWKAIEDGKTPGLRTPGTGTTSANCPLQAVGNVPCNGTNPPKYLDGVFNRVQVQDKQGRWTDAAKGGAVEVATDRPVRARVSFINLAEAEWLAEGDGAVAITAQGAGRIETPIPKPLVRTETIADLELILAPEGLAKPQTVTLSFDARRRTPFGERFTVTLVP